MKKLLLALAAGVLMLMAVPALAHDENNENSKGYRAGLRARSEMRAELHGEGEENERGPRGQSGFSRERGENHDNRMGKMKKQRMPHTIMGEVESVDATKGVIYLKGHDEDDNRPQLLVNAQGNATVFTVIKEDGAHTQTLADLAAGDKIMALVRKNKLAKDATDEQKLAARHQFYALIVTELMPPPAPEAAPSQPAAATQPAPQQ